MALLNLIIEPDKALPEVVSKVFLNANDAKNANSRKIYIFDNYPYNKFTSFIICENLRHLRAFETAPWFGRQ
jgi:hypothetical protein